MLVLLATAAMAGYRPILQGWPIVSPRIDIGYPGGVGIDLQATIRPVALEVGAGTLLLTDSTFARLGWSFRLHGPVGIDPTGDWSLFATPMVGWRKFKDVDPFDATATTHESGPAFTGSIEGILWITKWFGVNGRLTGGVDYWMYRDYYGRSGIAPEATLQLGFSI